MLTIYYDISPDKDNISEMVHSKMFFFSQQKWANKMYKLCLEDGFSVD